MAVPGFYEAVRANILHLLGISFQRIHKNVLGSYLNLEPVELSKLVGRHGSWQGCDATGAYPVGSCCLPSLLQWKLVMSSSPDVSGGDAAMPFD